MIQMRNGEVEAIVAEIQEKQRCQRPRHRLRPPLLRREESQAEQVRSAKV